jgi:copper chaperone CopZ
MAEKVVSIKGMTCGHCEGRVSTEILSIPGVTSVIASAEKANAVIISDSEISQDAVQRAVLAAGYSLLP